MTTIIGIKHQGGATLIADRRALFGSRPEALAEPKVFQAGDALIGVSGNLRTLQALKVGLQPRCKYAEETALQYITSHLVPLIRLTLSEQMVMSDDGPNEYIIACDGQIFIVSDNGAVTTAARGFDAIGSGEAYALGAMAAGDPDGDYKRRLWRAMTVAATLDVHTGAPFEFFELPNAKRAR